MGKRSKKLKVVKVFVYGPLMQHGGLGQHIAHMVVSRETAWVTGKLCMVQGAWYPALFEDADDVVVGELLTIRADCLGILDEMQNNGQLFKRELMDVITNDCGDVKAWAYTAHKVPEGFTIRDGDWLQHMERR